MQEFCKDFLFEKVSMRIVRWISWNIFWFLKKRVFQEKKTMGESIREYWILEELSREFLNKILKKFRYNPWLNSEQFPEHPDSFRGNFRENSSPTLEKNTLKYPENISDKNFSRIQGRIYRNFFWRNFGLNLWKDFSGDF